MHSHSNIQLSFKLTLPCPRLDLFKCSFVYFIYRKLACLEVYESLVGEEKKRKRPPQKTKTKQQTTHLKLSFFGN